MPGDVKTNYGECIEMRKELYERLNFEERTAYRIEKNSLHFSVCIPFLNFVLIEVLFLFLLDLPAMFLINFLELGIIFWVFLAGANYFYYIFILDKMEKEWIKKIRGDLK